MRDAEIDPNTIENRLGGRDRLDFGTVRPRVQIPGPHQNLNTMMASWLVRTGAPDHSRITNCSRFTLRDAALAELLNGE